MACLRCPTTASSIVMVLLLLSSFAIFLSAAWAMESDVFPNNEPVPVKPYHTLPFPHPPPPEVKPAGHEDKKMTGITINFRPPRHGGHHGPQPPPPDVIKPAGHDEDKKKGRGHSGHGFHLPKHPPPPAVKPAHHDDDGNDRIPQHPPPSPCRFMHPRRPPPPPETFLRPLLPPRTPPPQIRIIIRPRPPPPPRPAVSATKSSNEKTGS